MPRQIVTAKGHDRLRSLGWLGVAWMEHLVVHGPGDVQGEPVRHGDEYTGFIVDCYALGSNGRRLYDSSFLSRPKGCDKSGLGGRFGLFEALGPCRFAGWARGGEIYRDPWGLGFKYEYQPGEPMGRPVKVPYIRILATEEGQTGNVYDTIYYNLTEGRLAAAMPRRDNAGLTRIVLPGGGEITPSTASGAAKDGGKETWCNFDETHLYDKPELRRMYKVVTRNLRKRKKIAETWYLETTTMYEPGADSVAESTYKLAELIAAKKTKRERLLLDHRWGECEDLSDEKQLADALRDAYGDAIEWNHIEGLVDEILDPRSEVTDSIRYFLNDKSSAENAWIVSNELDPCLADPPKVIAAKEMITLGFDGSRKRSKGVTDATALIGCRLSDGHIFEIEVWEQPTGAAGANWQVPVAQVLAKVDETFQKYDVVGFYADPAKWESHVAAWESKYGAQLQVKSSRAHPIEWWMTGQRAILTVRALEKFRSAVLDQELTHDGSHHLTRHILNARQASTTRGIQIFKETPDSENKIDAAIAAVLAWQSRLDALAAGIRPKPGRYAPSRMY